MILRIFLAVTLAGARAIAQDASAAHHAGVDARGDHVMGFSHDKTTHHFRLYPDGGAIEVIANDVADAESRDQIRFHLSHIAGMFASGDFNAPMLIHDRVPPGVPTLRARKDQISYRYEDIDSGGSVRITTSDKKAIAAIHQFLKFQIHDHRTGDSESIVTAAPVGK